jgi:taurine dioxygenase
MRYESIMVRPVTPHIGAEVDGIDLTAPLSNRQVQDLHEALSAHLVLFFRDQKLTLESQKALGRHFGSLHIHPNVPGPAGNPEILPIHADGTSKRIAGEAWHSDVSCDSEPPLGSILHLHTVPAVGGDTLFASALAAYEVLSPHMQAFLDRLTATHDGGPVYRMQNAKDGIDDRGRAYPKATHPVVRVHPVTGRRALFVNAFFTVRINELPAAESRAVLAFLMEHLARPEFQMRFRWQADSVAFWDNRSTQHMALWDYYPHVRSGYRVTIKGDRPFGPALPRAA